MTQQTLRESLQKALIEHEQGIIHSFASASANIDTMVARKKATDEIMSAIKRAIPKKAKKPESDIWLDWDEIDFLHAGRNEAIDDFTKGLE